MEQALLEYGVLGICVVALGWWGWNRSKKVDDLQEARVEDAKIFTEMTERQISTNEKSAATADQLVKAVASLTDEIRQGKS